MAPMESADLSPPVKQPSPQVVGRKLELHSSVP